MSYILNIDTAVTTASVCLSKNGQPLLEKINSVQRNGAAWLHPAINMLMQEAGIPLAQVDAIAVSAGPGSYTGLRVGMSAAKGFCYGLKRPLILVSTLQLMAVASKGEEGLLCPMIDARRMEIFTAVYNQQLQEIVPPCNLIVSETPFFPILEKNIIHFSGNGYPKLKHLLQHTNARFTNVEASAKHMSGLSFSEFEKESFVNLAYAEPFYGKEFYSPAAKN